MADLRDNIRLTTVADLQALSELVNEYKKLGLSISGVAGASRVMYEQIKRDTLEQASATKQATLQTQLSTAELNRQSAELRKNNLELKAQATALNDSKKSSDGLFNSLSSLSGLRSQMIGLFGIMSVGSFAKDMIDAQSTVQAFGLSMKNLLGNAYGGKLLNDLKIFTVNTPLDFQQVIKSTNQLVGSFKAAGASSKQIGTEVPQILESIGNSAAALGGDDRMGRLIYAFSQVQATGRLMGTEVRQITETGFPMLAVLTQSLNERFPKLALSVSDVQKRISDGAVSFNDFKIAILSAGQAGGVFAGGMEARMATVAGSLDKLKESTFFALANIGNQFNDTAKRAIDFGSSIIKTFFGTNEAAQRSVEIISNLTKIYLGYRAALALVATTTLLKDAYDKASLITQGLLMRSKALLNGESQKSITLMAEETLAKAANTSATVGTTTAIEVMTVAEAKAAIATRSLSAAFGVIAIVLGVAYAAYEVYKSTVAEADEKQKEFNERISLGVAPIRETQSEFNRLANALKKSSDATQEKNTKLDALKAKFPEQLKGINDLSTAEKLLGDKANDTNIVKEYRLKLYNQLKGKFPEQTKGLNDVNFSESELAKVMKEVNGDFLIRQQLMKDEIRLNINKEQINNLLKEQIKLENDLTNATKNRNLILSGSKTGTKVIGIERSEYDIIQENIKAREISVLKLQETNAKIVENSIETTKKLKFNWDEQTKDANGAGKKQGEDADKNGKDKKEKTLKYQSETIMQSKIMDEIAFRRELESTRDNEIAIRTMEKLYADIRLKDAIGSQKQKQDEQTKLDNDFANDIANLRRKWNAKEKADALKDERAKNKEIEKEAKESAERLWKIITDRIDDELKAKDKLSDELQKLDEKNAKESIKLEEDKYELTNKLRILQAISRAKNSREVIEIENKEKEAILKSTKDLIEKQLLAEKSKLYSMWLLKKENTTDYKEQQAVILKLEQQLADAQIKIAEFVTEKTKDFKSQTVEYTKESLFQIRKADEAFADSTLMGFKQALSVAGYFANGFFDALENTINETLANSSDISSRVQAEQQRNVINIAKQGMSAIQSFMTGDIVGGTLKAFGALYGAVSSIGSKAASTAKYQLEVATQALENYTKVVEGEVDRIIARFDDIKEAYGEIKLESGATIGGSLSKDLGLDAALKSLWEVGKSIKEISKDIINIPPIDLGSIAIDFKTLDEWRFAIGVTGRSVDELIQAEITRGQQIQKTYEDAISKEKDLFEKRKDSIEQTYNEEVRRIKDAYDLQIDNINKRYDYEETRAIQKYNAETLGIVAAGTAQLEALITNEESLASVRKEFSDKRLEIEKAFPLASKEITADMSQAEITAINDSIKARDDAFAKLQGWYNEELTFIINSEGQKRKQYSATEVIQNGINAKLQVAALIFQGQEIQRVKDKNQAIIDAGIARDAAELVALGVKNSNIELATIDLNAKLVSLEQQKNKDIATSFKILTELLRIYAEDITKAMEDSTAKGSEAYRKLAQELNVVNELLKQIRNNSNSTPLNIGINGGLNVTPFEKGTDNTSVSLTGATVDNRGGKLAVLHPDEAVFSKADMTQMTRFLGKRPTRDEVIDRFKMGTKLIDSNSFIQKISPYVINKTEGNVNIDLQGLRSDLSKLTREVVKRQQPIVNIDKNGIRTYLTNINSQIEIKNQKFSS